MNSMRQEKTLSQSNEKLMKYSFWFILLASIILCGVTLSKQSQTWDILGYAGAVETFHTSDPSVIHNSVYESLKEYASEEELHYLVESTAYRKTMSQDAEAFNQQIPFYKIRIIFIFLILLVTKLGFNVMLAGHIVTAVTAMLGLMAFYFAYRKIIHPLLWLIVPMLFIVLGGLDMARIVTADPLAFLWTGLICFAFLNQRWLLLCGLLISSVLVRTDMILMVVIFTTYMMFFQSKLRIFAVATFIISFIVYMLVNEYAGNYGWSTVFYYALVSEMSATHPLEYSQLGVSFSQYFSEVIYNLGGFIDEPPLLLFQALVIFQFILYLISQGRGQLTNNTFNSIIGNGPLTLTVIAVIYVISHYVLFPLLENRFFIGEYMLALLGLLVVVSKSVKNNEGDRRVGS